MKDLAQTWRRAREAYGMLAPYGGPHKRFLLQGLMATVVLVGARLAFPWPLRGVMEIVFAKNAPGHGQGVVALVPGTGDPMWWLVGSFFAIIVIWALSEAAQRLAFTRFAVGLTRDARAAALRRLRVAASGKPGDLISTITGDIARVKTGIKSILIGGLRNGAFFVGVTIILGWIDPLISLVFFGSGVATLIVGLLGAWRASHPAGRSRKREGAFTTVLHGFFKGKKKLPKPTHDTKPPDSKSTRIEGNTTIAIHLVLAVFIGVILILTIQAGRAGTLSPGSVFTVLAYTMLMHNKTVSFGRRIIRGGRMLPSAERVAALAGPFSDGPPSGNRKADPRPEPPDSDTSQTQRLPDRRSESNLGQHV